MFNTPVKDIVYLSSRHELPDYLQQVPGVRWRFTQTPGDLKWHLQQKGEVFVVVRVDKLNERVVQAFLSWGKNSLKYSFIFIAQTIEKTVYGMNRLGVNMLFLYESEGVRITTAVTRCLQGLEVKSRKQERFSVQSQVMLKKSVVAAKSPTGGWVQFLREGIMKDYSQGGAQISLVSGGVKIKDFISLMYQNRQGQWISVESQVRWVVSNEQGNQIIGVQFLAVSA